MMLAQTAKFKSTGLLATFLVLFGSGVCLCNAQDGKSALGKLKLEGKHIERLVLRRNDGHTEVLNNPDKTVELPTGQYLLQDVRLKGGYRCQTVSGRKRVTIIEDKPALLKVGGPLRHTISVLRRDRILELTYDLRGAGGDAYAGSKRPAFTVHKGGREIATGEFEYG